MLGELLSDPRQRRTALIVLLAMLTAAIALIAFGVAFSSLGVLLVLGLVLICTTVAMLAKLVITSHVHLRGTASRLIALNDRYDATERWLERFDADARQSFQAAADLHASLREQLHSLEGKLGHVSSDFGDQLNALNAARVADAKSIEAERIKLADELNKADSELGESIKSAASSLEQLEKQTRQLGVSLDTATARAMKSVAESKAELSKLIDSIKNELGTKITEGDTKSIQEVERIESELKGSIKRASEEHDRKRETSATAAKQEAQTALTKATRSIAEKAEESASRVRTASSLLGRLRGDGYVQFSRVLTNDAEKQLASFGVTSVPAEFRYLERKLHVIEGLCEGRLAGSIDDAVARAHVSRLFKSDELRVLEIGVLFGVGAIFMHHALNPFYKRVRLTLLDPFDGYYGPDHLDPLTGQPVSEEGVRRNLARCGIPDEDFEIIKGFSTDDNCLAQVNNSGPYGVVIIDGDHSLEGIQQDFERYADSVDNGGVLIVDDYGSPDWPDVTAYTDSVIEKDNRFERVALIGKTVAYRRKAVKNTRRKSVSTKKPVSLPDGEASKSVKAKSNASNSTKHTQGNRAATPTKNDAKPSDTDTQVSTPAESASVNAKNKRVSKKTAPKKTAKKAASRSKKAARPGSQVESKPKSAPKAAKGSSAADGA